jgi:N-acetylglucosamine-6-phosphate deacetylase
MHKVGVVVSYNSDSDELARRMNTEAAKAVKYGGLSKDEALKFMTLNPARQLRIEGRVGSLEPGKDADVLIVTGDPIDPRNTVEKVYIDGRAVYDMAKERRRW